ncbi:MAG: DUF983 domain-containing protein [Acetobacterales bacterium]
MAGIACRCPCCGEGSLYTGYLTVRDRCAVCGLDMRRHDSGDGPAVFLIFILGVVVVGMAISVEVVFLPPLWLHALLWPPVILGLALILLRPAKAVLVALQYRHRPGEMGAADGDGG